MDAIPQDKKDKPLGTEDNPIPLVRLSESKGDAHRSKKIGRNQPAHAEAGKKYKTAAEYFNSR